LRFTITIVIETKNIYVYLLCTNLYNFGFSMYKKGAIYELNPGKRTLKEKSLLS